MQNKEDDKIVAPSFMGKSMEKMKIFKILYLANSGEIFGGGQVSLLSMLKRLNQNKFKPLVICPVEGSMADEFKQILNIHKSLPQLGQYL